jgi:hypothetical protein
VATVRRGSPFTPSPRSPKQTIQVSDMVEGLWFGSVAVRGVWLHEEGKRMELEMSEVKEEEIEK